MSSFTIPTTATALLARLLARSRGDLLINPIGVICDGPTLICAPGIAGADTWPGPWWDVPARHRATIAAARSVAAQAGDLLAIGPHGPTALEATLADAELPLTPPLRGAGPVMRADSSQGANRLAMKISRACACTDPGLPLLACTHLDAGARVWTTDRYVAAGAQVTFEGEAIEATLDSWIVAEAAKAAHWQLTVTGQVSVLALKGIELVRPHYAPADYPPVSSLLRTRSQQSLTYQAKAMRAAIESLDPKPTSPLVLHPTGRVEILDEHNQPQRSAQIPDATGTGAQPIVVLYETFVGHLKAARTGLAGPITMAWDDPHHPAHLTLTPGIEIAMVPVRIAH